MSHPHSSRLFLTRRSPFARRVRLALQRLNLPFEELMIDVFGDHPELLALNPLGMVPTLRSPDGLALFDSSAILEDLDDLTGGIWPRDRMQRRLVRNTSTLLTGMIQAAVSFYQESAMHDAPSPFWIRDHLDTIRRARERILQTPRDRFILNDELTQAGWDFAVAKEYVDLRVSSLAFPQDHPVCREIMAHAVRHGFH